jgi:hypothetical protein
MTLNPSEVMLHNAQILLPFIAPILVYRRGETNAANWLTGGTVFIARTVQNRFLVTAEHVIAEIDNLRTQYPITVFMGGNGCAPLDISGWEILDRDNHVDICTLQIPEGFDPAILNKRFFHLENWPHQRAQIQDRAIIVGYPAEHRSGAGNSIEIRLTPINDFVTDVGPRRFTIADENEEREILLNPDGFTVPSCFGGMSGSPIFRMIEDARPEFIGVFSEGSGGLRGTFFGAHADFICANGHLDHNRIPPP